MGLIYCSECGKQISDKAKVCPYCGAPKASTGVYCSECGKQIGEKEKVCPNCRAPRQSDSWSNFSDSWNTLLPDEKASIRKSLVYAVVCIIAMLIFVHATNWFGYMGFHDIYSMILAGLVLKKIIIWSLAWCVLLYSFVKIYPKSRLAASIVNKPITRKIALIRNPIFIIIGALVCILSVRGFINGIQGLHSWNFLADGTGRGFFDTLRPFCVVSIVGNALAFILFAAITLLEISRLSKIYRNLPVPQDNAYFRKLLSITKIASVCVAISIIASVCIIVARAEAEQEQKRKEWLEAHPGQEATPSQMLRPRPTDKSKFEIDTTGQAKALREQEKRDSTARRYMAGDGNDL